MGSTSTVHAEVILAKAYTSILYISLSHKYTPQMSCHAMPSCRVMPNHAYMHIVKYTKHYTLMYVQYSPLEYLVAGVLQSVLVSRCIPLRTCVL